MGIEKKLLKKESLGKLLEKILQAGKTVYAPKKIKNRVDFQSVTSAEELAVDYIQTTQSAKTIVFPKVEELFRFRRGSNGQEVVDRKLDSLPEVVLFAVHPCDAAALNPLKTIFNWDYLDSQFNNRYSKLTIIGLSCSKGDDYCFCTSVGLSPGDTSGSDILLTRLSGGDYLVEIITEKGRAIVDLASDLFLSAPSEEKQENLANISKKFSVEEVRERITGLFDNGVLWEEQSLRCLGCGACAYVCPTCACFDIQDEGTQRRGVRLRCWDSCGFSMFTLHTSGHNPREVQSQRWRQRLMHKFSYMPDRLSVLGCVGCGRCSRACPVDMNLKEHMTAIMSEKTLQREAIS